MTDPRMTPTNDAPVTVEQLEMQAARLDRIREDNDKPTLTDRAVLRETSDMLRRLAALASAPAGDGVEAAYRAGYRQACDDNGDRVDPDDLDEEVRLYCAALARPRAAVGERADLIVALTSMIERKWSSSEAGDWVLDEAARLLSALQSPPAKVEGE